jgi:hypothetical protein
MLPCNRPGHTEQSVLFDREPDTGVMSSGHTVVGGDMYRSHGLLDAVVRMVGLIDD